MRVIKAIGTAGIMVAIAACRTTAASLEPPDGSPTSPRGEQAALPEVAAALMSGSAVPAEDRTEAAGRSPHRDHDGHGMAHGAPSSEGGAGHDH